MYPHILISYPVPPNANAAHTPSAPGGPAQAGLHAHMVVFKNTGIGNVRSVCAYGANAMPSGIPMPSSAAACCGLSGMIGATGDRAATGGIGGINGSADTVTLRGSMSGASSSGE